MKPFLIIETGKPLPTLKRHGAFPDWIRVAAGIHVRDVKICSVANGEKLPDAKDFTGVLITGSGAMVTERHDWSERSAEWLNDAAHKGKALFGICYGHQLLAQTLGGKVDFNHKGRTIQASLLGYRAACLHKRGTGHDLHHVTNRGFSQRAFDFQITTHQHFTDGR